MTQEQDGYSTNVSGARDLLRTVLTVAIPAEHAEMITSALGVLLDAQANVLVGNQAPLVELIQTDFHRIEANLARIFDKLHQSGNEVSAVHELLNEQVDWNQQQDARLARIEKHLGLK